MVGFSAYIVLNKYNTSQNTVKSEASNVEELYWLAEQLPEPKRGEIQQLAVSYTRAVVDEEWPLMRDGQTSHAQERSPTISGEASRTSNPTRRPSKRFMLRSWSGFTIWTKPERFVC